MAKRKGLPPDRMELQCPHCTNMLELDAGFMGGVCRCSACGTLMTVPGDPRLERAERLSRPDRPDAPLTIGGDGRPQRPAAPPTPSAASRPAAPPSASAGATAAVPAGGVPSPEAQVFVTSSGKRVEITSHTAIPTAQKRTRQIIRATTIGVFVAILLVIIGIVLYLHHLMTSQPKGPEVVGPDTAIGYEPKVNPLSGDSPTFLGVPLKSQTVIVIEASGQSQDWLNSVKQVVRLTATRAKAPNAMQVVFFTDIGARAFPDKPQVMGPDDVKGLDGFLSRMIAVRTAEPLPGLDKALAAKPEQVILVVGLKLTDEQVEAVAQKLAGAGAVRFDAIDLATHNPRLKELTEKHQGRYLRMPSGQPATWLTTAATRPN